MSRCLTGRTGRRRHRDRFRRFARRRDGRSRQGLKCDEFVGRDAGACGPESRSERKGAARDGRGGARHGRGRAAADADRRRRRGGVTGPESSRPDPGRDRRSEELAPLAPQRHFEHLAPPRETLEGALVAAFLAFEEGDPGAHLGAFNLPFVPVARVPTVFGLKEVERRREGHRRVGLVLVGRRTTGTAAVLRTRLLLTSSLLLLLLLLLLMKLLRLLLMLLLRHLPVGIRREAASSSSFALSRVAGVVVPAREREGRRWVPREHAGAVRQMSA